MWFKHLICGSTLALPPIKIVNPITLDQYTHIMKCMKNMKFKKEEGEGSSGAGGAKIKKSVKISTTESAEGHGRRRE